MSWVTDPSPDPQLVELFRSVRQDSRSDPKPTEVAVPFTINITFDGGTALPLVGDILNIPLGRISGRIVGASMVADQAPATLARIDIRRGNIGSWPTVSPLYDTIPTLNGVAAVVIVTAGWQVNLQPGDVLQATLTAVDGMLTSVTLSIECIRLKWPSGSATLTGGGSNTVIDGNGATVTQRR